MMRERTWRLPLPPEAYVNKIAPEIVRILAELHPSIAVFNLGRYEVRKFSFTGNGQEIGEGVYIASTLSRKWALDSFVYYEIAYLMPEYLEKHPMLEEFGDLIENPEELSGGYHDTEALDAAICLLSIVSLANGRDMHIPMLDFQINCVQPENLEKVRDGLQEIGTHGFVVESGSAFHFYGTKLLKPKQWRIWLNRVSDPESPLIRMIDLKWVDTSLNMGESYLRLNPSTVKKRYQPKIVAVI